MKYELKLSYEILFSSGHTKFECTNELGDDLEKMKKDIQSLEE